jgi:diguanylate cyclase (GGDEF)-like protein
VGLGPSKISAMGLSLVTVAMMAAMFCGRRSHVALQAVFSGSLLVVAGAHAEPGTYLPSEVSTGAFDLIVVSAVVRLLRDAAVAGIARARRGEVTDPLTGLANRRGLEQLGGRTWAARARVHGPIAMLVIDVDHFKQINDTRGHAAGDDILRRLAEVLSSSVRADDVAVRLGGEEFLLLCSTPAGDAYTIAERLRATIEEQLGITVSIGVHETWPGAADDLPTSLWSAVDVADRAMYVAKTTGRNRVVAAADLP